MAGRGRLQLGVKEILDFVKIEHMLFSLPFVLIGFVLADKEFGSEQMDIVWIPVSYTHLTLPTIYSV